MCLLNEQFREKKQKAVK